MTEENKNMETQADPAEKGEQQEQGIDRTFTQEEVNGFVQNRISRIKGQIEKQLKADYDAKTRELRQREMKLTVKEALSERGMPKELSEIITCSDEEDMNTKLDALAKIYPSQAQAKEPPTGFRFGAPRNGGDSGQDPIRAAMGIK